MIVSEIQYYNLFSGIAAEREYLGSQVYNKLYNRSPFLFEQSNSLNNKIEEEMNSVLHSFSFNYRKIENFLLNREKSYRDTPVRVLSFEEDIYLNNILNIESEDVLKTGICIGSNRIFILEDLPITYKILNYKRDENYIISIFVGKYFYDNEYNYLKLIYDLSELYIDLKLKELGVLTNRYGEDYPNEVIVLNKNIIPSDAVFVTNYYSTIFKAIMYNTNNSIISKYDFVAENQRPIYSILGSESLSKIWDYSDSVINNEDTDIELLETINVVYNDLKKEK